MKEVEEVLQPTILLIDDEPDFLQDCQKLLQRRGYQCLTASESWTGIEMVKEQRPALVLTDLRMPKLDGLGVLEQVKRVDPDIIVVLITAYATIPTAIEATHKGAFDYLAKPFTAEQLYAVVERALEYRQLSEERQGASLARDFEFDAPEIIGTSPAMQRVFELMQKAAQVDASVLIMGESGTGKELIARAIHRNSPRRDKPFVPVDCVAIPETLIESELFGHEKGAFTDAHVARPGLFELAHGGTLFLDEIGDLPLLTQAKLLRVLEERQVRRIGSRTFQEVDVRMISATHRNLSEMVAAGTFREDLYYRLNVIPLAVPPLRDRPSDIGLLANHFLAEFVKASSKTVRWISASALMILRKYHWPGNVRELRNVIERAAALTSLEYITPLDLPPELVKADAELDRLISTVPFQEAKRKLIDDFERDYLTRLLAQAQGNVTQAARLAGMARTAFQRLLKKHGLTASQPSGNPSTSTPQNVR